jgi:hypothetical protein
MCHYFHNIQTSPYLLCFRSCLGYILIIIVASVQAKGAPRMRTGEQAEGDHSRLASSPIFLFSHYPKQPRVFLSTRRKDEIEDKRTEFHSIQWESDLQVQICCLSGIQHYQPLLPYESQWGCVGGQEWGQLREWLGRICRYVLNDVTYQ